MALAAAMMWLLRIIRPRPFLAVDGSRRCAVEISSLRLTVTAESFAIQPVAGGVTNAALAKRHAGRAIDLNQPADAGSRLRRQCRKK